MNIFNNRIIIGLCLAMMDIISMGITKQINLGIFHQNWLAIAFILYGAQMLIFNYGLNITTMATLNLTWNLFSNILITLVSILYFKENISQLNKFGILFGLLALSLFGLSEYYKN
jgi:hypothetical protein